jgi:hypothetical protein
MTNYSLKSCENLIDRYVNEYNGCVTTLEEGCLGLGKTLLHDAKGKKTILITEFFISVWSSGHKVVKYNVMPKKYAKLI